MMPLPGGLLMSDQAPFLIRKEALLPPRRCSQTKVRIVVPYYVWDRVGVRKGWKECPPFALLPPIQLR